MTGIHGDRGGVLEGIAHRVAHHDRVVQGRALRLQVRLDDLLGVVPGAAGVGHEDGLVEAEDGDGDQVADEEVLVQAGEGQGGEEDGEEDVEHALLRVLRADRHHLLAVLDGGLGRARVELDVALDELHGAVGARGDGLGGGAREPVDHRAARDQAQQEGRVEQGEHPGDAVEGGLGDVHALGQAHRLARQQHDDGEDQGRGAHHGRADQHRLGRRLEGVARAVVLLQVVLGPAQVGREAEVPLDLLLDAGDGLDHRELVDGLGVVGDRAVGVHRDRDRAHAQEAEGHQAEGEDRGRHHDRAQAGRRDAVGEAHQQEDRQAQPVGAEVAGDEAGEDAQGGAALLGGLHHLLHVRRLGWR